MPALPKNKFDKNKLGENTIKEWQSILDIVAEMFQVPAGLITRVNGKEIEIFLASETKNNPYPAGYITQYPDSGWYCEYTLKSQNLNLIPNALKDTKWQDNAAAVGESHMISYIGMPIKQPNGEMFGTICFLDNKEKSYGDQYIQLLKKFTKMIELSLHVIYSNDEIDNRDNILEDLSKIYPICACCKNVRTENGEWVQIEKYVETVSGKMPSHSVCPKCMEKEYPYI